MVEVKDDWHKSLSGYDLLV